MVRMNTLSIVVLFCDKDYQYLPGLLSQIDRKVVCNHEVILVDNREKFKDEKLDEIEAFSHFHSCRVISSGKNLGQLYSKKLAVNEAIGNYVWFFDGDDDFCDVVTEPILKRCHEDIIEFNFGYDNRKENELTYVQRFEEEKVIKNKKVFRTRTFLEENCCTCWNKWYRLDLLKGFFSYMDSTKKISAGEDIWINLAALNRANSIRCIPLYIYLNRPEHGISCNHIETMESFEKIIQGFDVSRENYKKEFPKSCALFDWDEKEIDDVSYYINRIYNSEKSIRKEAMELVLTYIPKETFINVLENHHDGFMARNVIPDEDLEDLIKELKGYLN